MLLTSQQQDALAEVINIAFGRAAASLSEITGHRVLVEVPRVAVRAISELGDELSGLIQGEITTVHQIFTGAVSGDAFLMLDYQGALLLCDLLTDRQPRAPRLDASDREALAEVGNILLNACLGTFGNLLQVHISFTVPRLHLEEVTDLVDSLTIGQDELRYALIIYTTFRLRESAIGGYLVIVLGIASLDRLLQAVEKLG